VSTEGHLTELRVDGARLCRRLGQLGQVGALPDGGLARLALTDADRAGRDRVVEWMRDLELDVQVDGIGNILAVLPGREPLAPVMTGSHLDTVDGGGAYDGSLGVLAGLEAVETLRAAGLTPRRPIAVASFTNEEGVRFGPDMMGSLVFAGGLALGEARQARDAKGVSVDDALSRIGYRGDADLASFVPHAFVELHVEQGPVLEAAGKTVGAVTGVPGISWTRIELTGEANHAGTTPMAARRDPAYAAGELITFVRRLAGRLGGGQVGTVGSLALRPNQVNVIPESAVLTVDLRNGNGAELREAERALAEHVESLVREERLGCEVTRLVRLEPLAFDPRLVDLVARTSAALGLPTERMSSGAGHDAGMIARICPATMIFVPSRGGISHSPAEHTEREHLVAGANLLLHVLLQLAEES
jgi:N-carbamoyl-L-amino-acid hydrolase